MFQTQVAVPKALHFISLIPLVAVVLASRPSYLISDGYSGLAGGRFSAQSVVPRSLFLCSRGS